MSLLKILIDFLDKFNGEINRNKIEIEKLFNIIISIIEKLRITKLFILKLKSSLK
jgi:hypothetical protein